MKYICENCKKEFEVGYGRKNRFCTRNCCASFNAKKQDPEVRKRSLEKARLELKNHHKKDVTPGNCCFCGKLCKNQNSLRNHERLCKLNPDYKENVKALKLPTRKNLKGYHFKKKQNLQDFTCEFCKQIFLQTARDVFSRHVKYFCKENPERINSKSTGKGSTPEKELERRRKLSEAAKRNLETGKTKAGYVMAHSSKRSYPEKYFEEVFKDLDSLKKEYFVSGYWLDFAIPEKMIYVEIDGEQHFSDKRIVEHDKKRTEKLDALGWKCLRRVRWSTYQKLSQDEKEKYCKELINELQYV